MTVMRLPLKQPFAVRVKLRYGKKVKLAAKVCLTKETSCMEVELCQSFSYFQVIYGSSQKRINR